MITDDGKVFNGLLVQKTESEVVLKDDQQKQITLKTNQIEEMIKSKTSLMPERLLMDLTAQEAADLLEYFRSIK